MTYRSVCRTAYPPPLLRASCIGLSLIPSLSQSARPPWPFLRGRVLLGPQLCHLLFPLLPEPAPAPAPALFTSNSCACLNLVLARCFGECRGALSTLRPDAPFSLHTRVAFFYRESHGPAAAATSIQHHACMRVLPADAGGRWPQGKACEGRARCDCRLGVAVGRCRPAQPAAWALIISGYYVYPLTCL